MAQNEISDYLAVDNDNTDVSGTTVVQNQMYPFHVPAAFRNLMGALKRFSVNPRTKDNITARQTAVASATTTDIWGATGDFVHVTGTATITSFGANTAGWERTVVADAAFTLTHNATSLIIPGGANKTVAAGDSFIVRGEGGSNAKIISYQTASGAPVIANYAGKLDVRRNRIVNGDMRVSQENGTTSGTTNGRYPVDQWAQYFVTSAGVLTVAQVASVTPAGSPNRLRATVTTADASLAAGEFWTLSQNLEGSNVADFQYGGASAKNAVLRFGFRGPAGTYGVALHNAAATRCFVAMFTISAGQANTDTVQTVSIPGDITGTWLKTDGVIGITLDIVLAAGTTFQGPAGWQGLNILATSAISNGMGTGSAVFELFDVGLRLDPDATGIYGQYEVGEVHPDWRAERYWEPTYYNSAGRGVVSQLLVGTSNYFQRSNLVRKAKIPTVSLVTGSWSNTPTFSASVTDIEGVLGGATFVASGTPGNICLAINARLS